jgi:uncharacterized protein (UPF0210 family)
MINRFEVTETNKMIENYNLDVRTITLGISLLDCISDDLETIIFITKSKDWQAILCRQVKIFQRNMVFRL